MTLSLEVRTIIDGALDTAIRNGLNWSPREVPADMSIGETEEYDPGSYLTRWLPTPSRVSPSEIREVSESLGIVITDQYASVLQYKHFMDMAVGDMKFFPHPSAGWQRKLVDHALNGHPRRLLADRGYIPFARRDDWGLYCFHTGGDLIDGEYRIFSWDHDDPTAFIGVASDLFTAMAQCHARKS